MMENNPFADLIPINQGAQSQAAPGIDSNNPFADLIPQDRSPQWMQSLANSAPVNAIVGAGDATQNMLANIANLVPGVHAPLAKSGEGLAYDIGNIGGQIANYALPMGATTKALLAAKSLPGVGALAEGLLGKTLSGAIGKNAIAGFGYGNLMNPDNRLEGGTTEGLLSGLGGALGHGISKLVPSNLFKTNISPEKLLENMNVARGTNTGLGDVIESPFLKRQYENVLPKILGSGAENTMQGTAAQVTSRGNDLLNQMLGGNSPSGVGQALQKALKKSYNEVLQKSSNNYSEIDKLANLQDIGVRRENFSSKALELLKNSMASKELRRELSPDMLNDLKFYSEKPYKPRGSYWEKSSLPANDAQPFNSTNIFRGELGKKAAQAFMDKDKYGYRIYSSLKDALTKDIDEAIPKDASNLMRQKYDIAQNFYKTSVVPLEDKNILKFTREGGDPDLLLSSFVKTGTQDRGSLLRKLSDNLQPHLKGLLPYGFFSKAIENGELNPLKLRTLYKSLGPTQKEALFSQPELAKSMSDYSKLVGMNTESLTQMFNAKTGQRALDTLPWLVTSGVGAGFLGGLPALGGMAALSRAATKGLTSEGAREKFVQKMLQNKKSAGNNGDLTAAIAAALGQQFQ